MTCPHCGRLTGSFPDPCPHCPDAHMPVRHDAPSHAGPRVVDPEVLAPGEGRQDGETLRRARVFLEKAAQQQFQGDSQEQHSWQRQAGAGQAFRLLTWRLGAGHGTGEPDGTGQGGAFFSALRRDSCLPGLVTLTLMLACVVRFGVLAALGFMFFYLAGSALSFGLQLRQAMRGRPLSPLFPWVGRVAVWGVSWTLAGWLSGG